MPRGTPRLTRFSGTRARGRGDAFPESPIALPLRSRRRTRDTRGTRATHTVNDAGESVAILYARPQRARVAIGESTHGIGVRPPGTPLAHSPVATWRSVAE